MLLSGRDRLLQAEFATPGDNGADWLRRLQATKKMVGPQRYAVLLPLNEFEPLQVLALQQPEAMLREGNRYGNFRSPSFRRALAFYHQLFTQSLAPMATNTQISNVWDELGNGFFSFYVSGPWNIGEFKRRLPAGQQGSWMTAPMPGPDGPGASSAGGSTPVIFRPSEHKASAWGPLAYLSPPQVQRRFYEITG